MQPGAVLILPCETRVREFDAKLLLGMLTAAAGGVAIVGSKKPIDLSLSRFPPGIYVGKSLTARSRHNLAIARACGHRVVLWDEEGLVWASPEVYWKTKVDPETLNAPELLIAWGEDNAQVWRDHPDYAGPPIEALGNPRADLLTPRLRSLFEAEVGSIRATHGRFILINTNFSRVNHLQPRQNRHLKWLREKRPDDPRGGFAAHKFELFQAFSDMVPELARRLPEVHFVVRPHPSEKRQTWEHVAAGFDNVSVAQHGNVVAWLLASDGLIHNGCTTAVEAFQLDRPAIAFRPVRSARYDHALPNDISLAAADLDELAGLVERASADSAALFSEQAGSESRQVMRAALAGFGEHGLASERIVARLGQLSEQGSIHGARSRWMPAVLAFRRLLRLLEQRLPGTANYRPYLAHMFPDIDQAEVEQSLRQMASCLDIAPVPRVRELETNVFRLEPA
ncbi:MAG: hypothetical protein EA419_05205 [Wenzhouxiangella sp.]|nr:MAG: hypothetical protein EA419_05205 [Wenzhouxiangella sp.]